MEDMSQYPLELTGDDVPMVRFANVTKRYGALTVLDSLNLDIETGEMVSVIGPPGLGKTTVLRMLMTLETVNGGVIYLDGKPLTHQAKNGVLVPASKKYIRSRKGDIGMCFQHFNLFPHMTALQNCIEAPVQVPGMSKKDAVARRRYAGNGRVCRQEGPVRQSAARTHPAIPERREIGRLGPAAGVLTSIPKGPSVTR